MIDHDASHPPREPVMRLYRTAEQQLKSFTHTRRVSPIQVFLFILGF